MTGSLTVIMSIIYSPWAAAACLWNYGNWDQLWHLVFSACIYLTLCYAPGRQSQDLCWMSEITPAPLSPWLHMIFTVSAVMARRPQGQPRTHVIGLAALMPLPCPGGEETLMWTKGGIACWEVGRRASQTDAANKVDCVPGAYGKGPLAGSWGLEKGTVMQIETKGKGAGLVITTACMIINKHTSSRIVS